MQLFETVKILKVFIKDVQRKLASPHWHLNRSTQLNFHSVTQGIFLQLFENLAAVFDKKIFEVFCKDIQG